MFRVEKAETSLVNVDVDGDWDLQNDNKSCKTSSAGFRAFSRFSG